MEEREGRVCRGREGNGEGGELLSSREL